MIRRLAFPVGRRWKAVSDARIRSVAASLSQPGDTRDALAEGMYMPPADSDERVAALDRAMRAMAETSGLRRKLRRAIRKGQIQAGGLDYEATLARAMDADIIDETERKRLLDTERLRAAVIRVDEFDRLGLPTEEGATVAGMG